MKSYVDVLIELKGDNERYFKNFEHYARIAKEVVRKELKDVRVFVFGSVVTRNYTPASDIDLIIVSKTMPKKLGERAKIKAKIYKRIGFLAHLRFTWLMKKNLSGIRSSLVKKLKFSLA